MKLYRHCDSDEEHISIHDCKAVKAKYKNNTLSFVFEEGLWLGAEYKENITGEPVKTGPAKVQFQTEADDELKFYVFIQKRKKTIREEWDIDKFLKKINSSSVSIEFLYQYKNNHSRIIECCIWSGKKVDIAECEIRISPKKVFFMWDRLSDEPEVTEETDE